MDVSVLTGQTYYKKAKEKEKKDEGKSRRGLTGIRANLAIIPGPRTDRCKKHLLVDILLLCIIATACGVESVEGVKFFGITHIHWLKQYLVLPHGIPSADTILRVSARIGHTKFEGCFLNWARGYFKGRAQPGPVIATDGKTVRGSASERGKAVRLVSAWADALGLVPGQVKTAGKSNGITATPGLLAALGVAGCAGQTHYKLSKILNRKSGL